MAAGLVARLPRLRKPSSQAAMLVALLMLPRRPGTLCEGRQVALGREARLGRRPQRQALALALGKAAGAAVVAGRARRLLPDRRLHQAPLLPRQMAAALSRKATS